MCFQARWMNQVTTQTVLSSLHKGNLFSQTRPRFYGKYLSVVPGVSHSAYWLGCSFRLSLASPESVSFCVSLLLLGEGFLKRLWLSFYKACPPPCLSLPLSYCPFVPSCVESSAKWISNQEGFHSLACILQEIVDHHDRLFNAKIGFPLEFWLKVALLWGSPPAHLPFGNQTRTVSIISPIISRLLLFFFNVCKACNSSTRL